MVVKVNKSGTGKNMLYLLWRTSVLAGLSLVLCKMAAPAAAAPAGSETRAMMYLAQYGYLSPAVKNPSSGMIIDEPTWTKAIAEFQSFAGLNATGELDSETSELMTLPRCGVRDKVGFGETRSKRYALQGSRWRVKNLTYKISKYPKLLSRIDVDLELSKAFNVWAGYTDLSFTQKRSGQVHIEIRFEKGEHGDGDPFDGPGGTLAHAYFPVYGGDAHFDDAEQWTINSRRGTNLFQVAAHEFGHSLGLSHSDVKSALMAPFYRGYDPSFTLDTDDIQGIQALYGRKTQLDVGPTAQTTPEPANAVEDSLLCSDGKVDTIFNSADGSTFAFKGDHYWRLTEDGVAAGYPRPIARAWPGLPGNIDAAFTYKNGKTYFFKGSKYWRFNGQRIDGEYPKEISEGFTGIPDNIDAALIWSGNGKIYFYKGTKFWRFDPTQRPPVKSTYPKPISNWEGVPDNMDAAIQYTNGYTYFFKDGGYYRFNDRTFSVDAANPAFPRSAGYWWFGCKSAPAGTIGGNARQELEPSANGISHVDLDNYDNDVSDIVFDAADTDNRDDITPRENSGCRTHSAVVMATVAMGLSLLLTPNVLTSA